MAPRLLKETDLAAAVIDWLTVQHWDVYQEVKFSFASGIADIAAVRNGKLWIIECKTSLSFTVLAQAAAWKSHYRSIAIPETLRSDGRSFAYDYAKHTLKIGVLEYGKRHWHGSPIDEYFPAPIMREYHHIAKQLMGQLSEGHKTHAQAGSAHGDRYTPYRQTMDAVKEYVTNNPGCTIKDIMNNLPKHHYSNGDSAKGSIRIALANWENDWCEVISNDNKVTYMRRNHVQRNNTR